MLQTSYVTLSMSLPSLGLSFPIWAGLAPDHLPSADGLCLFPKPQQPLPLGGLQGMPTSLAGHGWEGAGVSTEGTEGIGTEGQDESRNQACLLLPRITSSPPLKIMSC